MSIDGDIERLMLSIHGDRLVVLCGAGLSMAPPSSLPSAWTLAEDCHTKHQLSVDPNFDKALEHDLEGIAEHFVSSGTLKSYFIRNLVPWSEFAKARPNLGHEALADFLMGRMVETVLSSNYDELIETAGKAKGADLQVALNGDEANVHATHHSPFLKFHGCSSRDRDNTVWTKSQITDVPVISDRIESIRQWMNSNLREKDLLVVGFWSDWSYLNSIFDEAFKDVTPLSITVVDPCDKGDLETKAPCLWEIGQGTEVNFNHVKESGASFLDQLRKAFSKQFLRRVFALGRNAIETELGSPIDDKWLELPDLTSEDLYHWRQDALGVARGSPPREKNPIANEVLGFFHLLLRSQGAEVSERGYELGGEKIRIVNGSGKFLASIVPEQIDAPVNDETTLVICVGAADAGLPAQVIPKGDVGSMVRPKPMADFITIEAARERLEI